METPIPQLIERIRAGDQQAAEELVRRFEPQIRREVRLRLTDPGLRRVIDSADICQSVLGNFFARAALGQFELKDTRRLIGLLVTMAQNRLNDWARQMHRQRRDQRRTRAVAGAGEDEVDPVSPGPSPSQEVAGSELLSEFRRRLSDEERRVANMRADGCDWKVIAEMIGDNPAAVRKRFERAIDRVQKELGL